MSLKSLLFSCIFCLPALADEIELPDYLGDTRPSKVSMCFDGGGIRGIFSLEVLKSVTDGLPQPLTKYVDLFAGPSTGGMIALGLSMDKPIEDILKIYTEKGSEVFYTSWRHTFRSLFGLVDQKYSVEKFEPLLQNFYGHDIHFSDIKAADAVVYSVDITQGSLKAFSTYSARKDPAADYAVWFAARATSAAPTYFKAVNDNGNALVDGGLAINEASHQAALLIQEEYGWDVFKQLKTISIGTGTYYEPLHFETVKDWGVAKWVEPISSVMMNVDSNTADKDMRRLYPSTEQYVRLNTSFQENIALDGVDAASITKLQTETLTYIKQNPEMIDAARKILLKNGVKPVFY
ncbi:patatin-like phospholipase family protein [Candidatus Paracaedibacter symbiosus]|uniref:patatin-like phospholipase family protein n=1 Tax=Candidatus Paracaedibacter symbiosus TaxID=244582 RepID=UPI000509D845|nr:patatin-like phospholipase family protein [Candidatus Paracaedibacter symbiosus]